MKVALEKGETLDIALVEGDRIVGTLSLELRAGGVTGTTRAAADYSRYATSDVEEGSGAMARPRRAGNGRKRQISDEARAKMAEAQKRRWEKYRQQKTK